jgi:hypothetical protein
LGVKDRVQIQRAYEVFCGYAGLAIVKFDDDSRKPLLAERNKYAAPRDGIHVFRNSVAEDNVQGHGKGNVAELRHRILL